MESIIEFPKPVKFEQVEPAVPSKTIKVFNISDWTPKPAALNNAGVDSWPFCAA
jgi:hypothetical protein